MHEAEQNLKTYLTNYEVGERTNDTLRLLFGISFDGLANTSIYDMNDAIEQLRGRLNDNSLRNEFLKYLGAFNIIPKGF